MARKYGICLAVIVAVCCLIATGCGSGNTANTSIVPTPSNGQSPDVEPPAGSQTPDPIASNPAPTTGTTSPAPNPSPNPSRSSSLQTRFVYYISGAATAAIVGAAIDSATGFATVLPNPPALSGAVALVADPQGRFLYALTSASQLTCSPDATSCPDIWFGATAVLGFQIDQQSGALTPVPGSPLVLGQQISGGEVVINPNGRFLYASAGDGLHVFSIDQASGLLTEVPGSPVLPTSDPYLKGIGHFGFDATGRFMINFGFSYVAVSNFNRAASWNVDQDTGLPTTLISEISTSLSVNSFATSPDGRFYFIAGDCMENCNFTDGVIAVLGIGNDGSLSLIAGPFTALYPPRWPYICTSCSDADGPLVIDPAGHTLYAFGIVGNYAFHIDPQTGTLSPPGGVYSSPRIAGRLQNNTIAIDATGRSLFGGGLLDVNNGGTWTTEWVVLTYSIASDGSVVQADYPSSSSNLSFATGDPIVTINLPAN